MSTRRFQVTHLSTTIFVDRLRLGCFEDLGKTFLTAGAEDPEGVDPVQQPIVFDIPKQDLAAYRRAAAAFNAIMDEHERHNEQRNARRRQKRIGMPRQPVIAMGGAYA